MSAEYPPFDYDGRCSCRIPHISGLELDGLEGTVVRSVNAEGRVALPGFMHPTWIPCMLHVLQEGCFICAWQDSQSPVIYYGRPDL